MPEQHLKPEEEFVLDMAMGRVDAAKRAVDQARRELGAAMRSFGLSASARHLERSRQWALQLAKEAEEAESARSDSEDGQSQVDDLADSIRRLGIIEPIVADLVDEGFLRVVDGNRRLRAAKKAGISSLPVMVNLASGDRREEIRGPAEDAARNHRRVAFRYARPDGVESERTVDVWGVVHRADRSYIIGYDQVREAPRTFRLSRIVGGISFIGDGVAPPEDFSAEASVWGPLDPDSLEALEESFRNILKSERSSPEDETPASARVTGTERPASDAEAVWGSLQSLFVRLEQESAAMATALEEAFGGAELQGEVERDDLRSLQRLQEQLEELESVSRQLAGVVESSQSWQHRFQDIQRRLTLIQDRMKELIMSRWLALGPDDAKARFHAQRLKELLEGTD